MAVAAGRFDAGDLRSLVPLLVALRSFPRHASLWDVSRVGDVEPDAFTGLQDYFAAHFREPLPIVRVAVLAPSKGPLRAAAAGMFSFLEPPYPARAFTDASAALDWLGAPREACLRALEEESAALLADAFDDVVSAWVEANAKTANIERCAAGVGVSRRTLQRRLRERDTSFEALANRARVRVAERLLATDASLGAIAFEAGFSSPERFSRIFRDITGEAPSAARAKLHR
ncbi:MAG TPA: helix-turn-helix transcriptional regulator [Polyangiaceae bacterium]